MREPHSSSHCVVVGVDGSRSGLHAALWAVDEAVVGDVPLRLVYAIESSESESDADGAIRQAFAAIESTRKQVKIEAEVVHERPIAALLAESRSAAMVCVGSTGLKHAVHGHIGSTASALVSSGHCAIAVVPITAVPTPVGSVLAVVDESLDSTGVLALAVREARLRGGPLCVLTAAAPARLERYLAFWRRNYPDVDIQPVTRQGCVVDYLEYRHRTTDPVQVAVVDPRRPGPADVLLTTSGRAALDAARCTLLVCDRQRWL
jgi:nucleotide-binding universal stress UspA family protein